MSPPVEIMSVMDREDTFVIKFGSADHPSICNGARMGSEAYEYAVGSLNILLCPPSPHWV